MDLETNQLVKKQLKPERIISFMILEKLNMEMELEQIQLQQSKLKMDQEIGFIVIQRENGLKEFILGADQVILMQLQHIIKRFSIC